MIGGLPKAIEEPRNMPRKTLFLLLGFGALFFPWRQALMLDRLDEAGRLRQIPIPPSAGRGTERRVTHYLTAEPTSFANWLSKGKRYLTRKEFEQAVWAFRKALEMRPLSSEAHFLLGFSFEKRLLEGLPGDLTSWEMLAEEEYRTAIGLDDHLPARFNLGMLLARSGRQDAARREFEHILTISPRSTVGRRAQVAMNRAFEADLMPRTLEEDLPLEISAGEADQ